MQKKIIDLEEQNKTLQQQLETKGKLYCFQSWRAEAGRITLAIPNDGFGEAICLLPPLETFSSQPIPV
jgi:hypothetical protein